MTPRPTRQDIASRLTDLADGRTDDPDLTDRQETALTTVRELCARDDPVGEPECVTSVPHQHPPDCGCLPEGFVELARDPRRRWFVAPAHVPEALGTDDLPVRLPTEAVAVVADFTHTRT